MIGNYSTIKMRPKHSLELATHYPSYVPDGRRLPQGASHRVLFESLRTNSIEGSTPK